MTFTSVLFYIVAIIMIVAACRVITAKQTVTAVLHLILVFANASMLWMLLGAEFLSLLLILVYVGAVMVLFLFVVMMLDVRNETLQASLKAYLPLGVIVALIFVAEISAVLLTTWMGSEAVKTMPADYNNARAIGESMYGSYGYAIQVAAALLLVGMISAISLTMRRRKDAKASDPAAAVRVKAKDRLRMVSMPAQVQHETVSSTEGEAK